VTLAEGSRFTVFCDNGVLLDQHPDDHKKHR